MPLIATKHYVFFWPLVISTTLKIFYKLLSYYYNKVKTLFIHNKAATEFVLEELSCTN